jgi:hypothetical protein
MIATKLTTVFRYLSYRLILDPLEFYMLQQPNQVYWNATAAVFSIHLDFIFIVIDKVQVITTITTFCKALGSLFIEFMILLDIRSKGKFGIVISPRIVNISGKLTSGLTVHNLRQATCVFSIFDLTRSEATLSI